MTASLPPDIAEELAPLLGALAERGFLAERLEQSVSFGNIEVVFSGPRLSFSVVRDRGQFHIGRVEQADLEPMGLWRTFTGVRSLGPPLLTWLEAERAV